MDSPAERFGPIYSKSAACWFKMLTAVTSDPLTRSTDPLVFMKPLTRCANLILYPLRDIYFRYERFTVLHVVSEGYKDSFGLVWILSL